MHDDVVHDDVVHDDVMHENVFCDRYPVHAHMQEATDAAKEDSEDQLLKQGQAWQRDIQEAENEMRILDLRQRLLWSAGTVQRKRARESERESERESARERESERERERERDQACRRVE